MLRIAQAVRQLVSTMEWHAEELDNRILRVPLRSRHGHWQLILQWTKDQDLFACHSVCPLNVPEARRERMAEFVARANYGLMMGNFDLDFSDGEIRFRTTTLLHERRIGSKELHNLVTFNLSTMDKYLPGIMAVAFGDKSPSEVITEVEDKAEDSNQETDGEQPREVTRPHNGRLLGPGVDPTSN